MAHFAPDRFDGVPDSLLRVGAHRAGGRRHHGLIVFAWAALACGILVGAGYGVLLATDASFQFNGSSAAGGSTASASATGSATGSATPTPTVTPTPTPTPATPGSVPASTTISVLNSTTTRGLAATAGTKLKTAGWKVGNEGNATKALTQSVVYYTAGEGNESIALGVAKSLGIATVQVSTEFPGATVTVVLGSDFSG
ncbi:LytR C-terminal domain-containing protein [Frondihabitans cladoniiphilus]|uniref:LytR/CpsA/Psr regulator C-terminal domain-containing protein n=1 Tax=Frondihabitans cladoniiphilus TaxID=715785 RepID=A0ABP8VTZ1_9MICO